MKKLKSKFLFLQNENEMSCDTSHQMETHPHDHRLKEIYIKRAILAFFSRLV